MPRKTFIHYLFSKNKKPLFVDENGHVQEGDDNWNKPNGQPARLQYSPEGWKDTLVKYARNIKYWGLFRDMTVPMKFPEDGAKILRYLLRTFGIEYICYLGLMKFNRTSLPYNYEPWLLTEVNFVKYHDMQTGFKVEALEGGPGKYLKAYENTVYEIPVDEDLEAISVLADGMELDNNATFFIGNGYNVADPFYDYADHLVEVEIVAKEIQDIGGVQSVERMHVGNTAAAMFATRKYVFQATASGTVKVDWDFTLTVNYVGPPAINPAAILRNGIRRIDKDGNLVSQTEFLNRTAAQGIPGIYPLAGTANIDVVPGDELYFFTIMSPNGASGDDNTQFTYGGVEPSLIINYTYLHPASIVKGLFPYRLFEKLVEKMTEGKYGVKSDWLTAMKDIVITSGDALRGNEGSVIKISFTDFFKAMNRWCIRLGTEDDKFVIEPYATAFGSGILTDLGQVSNAETFFAEDIVFNTIKVGYANQTYEGINGKLEFNAGQQWTTPGTKVVKELDLISPIRADPFGIELLRINFGQLKTTDSKADNDPFFLNIAEQAPISTNASFVALGSFMLVPNNVMLQAGQVIRIAGSVSNDGDYPVNGVARIFAGQLVQLTGVLVDENNVAITIEFLSGNLYILNRPAYSSVTGLLHPGTAFNIELSPKRALLNNGAFIHSCMDVMDTGLIKLRSADKNADLETTLAGVTVTEKADLEIGNLAAQLFIPHYITFTTQVPINLVAQMKLNPYDKVQFTWNGQVWYGYLFDGGIKPATEDTQTWKLLSAPENDLLKFNSR